MAFAKKNNSLFSKVSPKFAEIYSSILSIFFPAKVLSLKVFKKILGRRMHSRTSKIERFADIS